MENVKLVRTITGKEVYLNFKQFCEIVNEFYSRTADEALKPDENKLRHLFTLFDTLGSK
jgi:Ca2+-binding EF-hand superfamily protein